MTGKRKTPSDLPVRMYLVRGRYIYVNKAGSQFGLGKDKQKAMNEYERHRAREQGKTLKDLLRFEAALFAATKKRAARRDMEFALTPEWLHAKIAKGRCSVTAIQFNYDWVADKRSRPWIPSIDRIDPRKGYIPENCRVVCAYVNMALNEFGVEALHKIRRMAKILAPSLQAKKIRAGRDT